MVDGLGARAFPLELMSEEEAVSLLTMRASEGNAAWQMSPKELEMAHLIAKETGYLPLALQVAAGLLGRHYGWEEVYQLIRYQEELQDECERPDHFDN